MKTYEKATLSIGGELVEVTNLQMNLGHPRNFRALSLMRFESQRPPKVFRVNLTWQNFQPSFKQLSLIWFRRWRAWDTWAIKPAPKYMQVETCL